MGERVADQARRELIELGDLRYRTLCFHGLRDPRRRDARLCYDRLAERALRVGDDRLLAVQQPPSLRPTGAEVEAGQPLGATTRLKTPWRRLRSISCGSSRSRVISRKIVFSSALNCDVENG